VNILVLKTIGEINAMLRGQISQSQGVARGTTLHLAKMMEQMFWYQTTESAKNSISSIAFNRASSSIHTNSPVLERPDIHRSPYSRMLPICEIEHEGLMDRFVHAIKMHLRGLGINPSDEDDIRIFAQKYMIYSGMGEHPDSPRKINKRKIPMRWVLSAGASRDIVFRVYSFTEDWTEGDSMPLVQGAEHTLTTLEVADSYMMTGYASGALALGFSDANKTTALQARHSVRRLDLDAKSQSANFVIDFNVDSIEVAMDILQKHGSGALDLSFINEEEEE
jgi:hypothetical protein